MDIISIQKVDVSSLKTSLLEGKTLVYPTETCYGLGCDATNENAVSRIFDIKKRQRDKPLLIVVPSVEMIARYVQLTPLLTEINEKYWPGPLTVVAPLYDRGDLASGVIGPDNTVAFRVTSHPFIQSLLESIDAPIVSTSANISSEKSPYEVESIIDAYKGKECTPDILIDGGELPHQLPSTIVSIVGDTIQILRQGDIQITREL